MPTAICVENLGKSYRVDSADDTRLAYHTLRETLTRALARRTNSVLNQFWALQGISFQVQPGEVLGVIGRNGAGKSTLLKILSRITRPTTGRAAIRGRVGSLLEVGTGFHPELSGRENVYLSGSILGMTRAEIRQKFDAIVAFAEVERFLDTPVKRYSSGMYVRLAFSVAVHLEPEILIVDEVLAVGDATYQRRCIERMSALAAGGRTILFVSHNMDLIPRLCHRALLLDAGRAILDGPAPVVMRHYLDRQLTDAAGDEDLAAKTHTGDGRARFTAVRHVDPRGRPLLAHPCGDDLILQIDVEAQHTIPDVALAIVIQTLQGARIITSWTREVDFRVDLEPGRQTFQCRLKNVRLRPGRRVNLHLWMATQSVIDCVEHARIIDITDTDDTRDLSTDPHHGVVVVEYLWSKIASAPNSSSPIALAQSPEPCLNN
jgi:lipopolysaccharide transport system ATP-binding protein